MANNFRDNDDFNHLEGGTDPLRQPLNPTYDQGNVKGVKTGISSELMYRIGLEDLYSWTVWRASVAELLGTAILVFTIATVAISSYESDIKTPNLVIAIGTTILITILLLALAPVSGGHVNPAISLSVAFAGLISFSRAAIYIVAQCLGAVLAASALKAVVNESIAAKYSLGGCTLSMTLPGPDGPTVHSIATGQALVLEIICTFVFLFPALLAFDGRQFRAFGPIVVFSIIGIVIGVLVFISTTVTTELGYAGAGINPARCIGPAIVAGGQLWDRHWVFWVGPLIGSVAFYLYTLIIPKEPFMPRMPKSD